MQGTIEKILDKVAKTSGKKYISFLIDGQWYSYWKILPEDLMVDSKVDFDFTTTKSGDMEFKTVSSIKVIGQKDEGNIKDKFTPMGNMYAMCEEKLNGIIEQNALVNTQLKNLTLLVMEIVGKLQIDINKYKPSSEL